MVYLDNAATSYPKPEKVYETIDRCMREYCANPGRSGHSMSLSAGRAVLDTREKLAGFFNMKNPMQLCFTKNATEALNIAIKGIVKPSGHVITTSMEHNSVVRPLKTLESDIGIDITIIQADEDGNIDAEDIRRNIKRNTDLIVSTISSNVNGIILPVGETGRIAGENGIPFLVDASQGAGTLKIDVHQMNIDMLAFPGHKSLLGPQGTGGLYARDGIKLRPVLQGGTGSFSENLYQPQIMPDMLESGTLNTPGIAGLGCGVGFINSFGLENLQIYKHMLVKRLHEGIEDIKNVKLYSKKDIHLNSGIVAMNFKDSDSSEVSHKLDRVYHIATRAGLHCSPLAHKTLGTMNTGIVRFSVGCFNTIEEIDFTVKALEEISVLSFQCY